MNKGTLATIRWWWGCLTVLGILGTLAVDFACMTLYGTQATLSYQVCDYLDIAGPGELRCTLFGVGVGGLLVHFSGFTMSLVANTGVIDATTDKP